MAAGRGGGTDVHGSPYTAPVTDQFGDRIAHQVFDQHMNPESIGGALRTVCGEWIIPAPLMAPIGNPCAVCSTKIGSRTEPRTPRRWRGWLWA
jgi:hypothetical protein